MSRKWKIIIGIVVAIVVVGAVSFGAVQDYIVKSDPVNYLLYTSSQGDYKAVDADSEMDFSLDEEAFLAANPDMDAATIAFINQILDRLDVNANVKFAYDETGAFDFYESMNAKYNDNNLLTFAFQLSEDQMLFDMPELFPSPISETYQNLIEFYEEGEEVSEMMDMKPYVQILLNTSDDAYKALSAEPYLPAIKAFFEPTVADGTEKVEINGTTYTLDKLVLETNYKDSIQMLVSMLETAKTDENLKALVKVRIESILNQLEKSGDYEKLEMTAEEVAQAKTELETGFDEGYAEILDEIIGVYQDSLNGVDGVEGVEGMDEMLDMPMTMTFYIDGNDMVMRRFAYAYSMEGINFSQTMTYKAFGEDVEMPEINPEDTASLVELSSDTDALNTFIESTLVTGVDGVVNSQAMVDLMSDLKNTSADLSEDMQYEIASLVDQYEMYKDGIGEMVYSYYQMYFMYDDSYYDDSYYDDSYYDEEAGEGETIPETEPASSDN